MRRLVLIALASLAALPALSASAGAAPHIEMGVDSQGRVVASVGPGPAGRTGVVRLDPSGLPDRSFAGDGSIGPFASKSPAAIGLGRDGSVVVAEEPRKGRMVLRRYRAADGSVDKSFGRDGKVMIPVVPANRVLVQPDGHVVLLYQEICPSSSCGYLLTYLQFVRYSRRGKPEKPRTMYQEEWDYEAVAMDSRGSFIVKGSDLELGEQTFVRFRPDGKVDPSMGGKDGLVIEPPPFTEGEPDPKPKPGQEEVPPSAHMAIAPDGGFVLADDYEVREALVSRRLSTGYLDKAFGTADNLFKTTGRASCKLPGEPNGQKPFDAVAVAPDGSVLAAGGIGSCGLVRFTAAGLPDPTFGTDGRVDLEAVGLPRPSVISLAPEGDIVVGGWSPAEKAAKFARFGPDGRLDPTFGFAGVATVSGF